MSTDSASEVWEALEAHPDSDGTVVIGLAPEDQSSRPMTTFEYRDATATIIEGTPGLRPLTDGVRLVLPGDSLSNTFRTRVTSRRDVERLLASPLVRYVEPATADIILADSLSCGADAWVDQPLPRSKNLTVPSWGDLAPYSYGHHEVPHAWAALRDYGVPGQDVGIAVLDTGISEKQTQFSSRFTAFFSRKPLVQLNTTNAGLNDDCSHGTKMAAVTGAPLDGINIVGIAYGSDLTSIKVVEDPHAGKADIGAICDGISLAITPSDRPPARVIAMAFGMTYYSPTVADCIRSAYASSPATIFVAAAGSSVTEVVFPANLDCCVLAASMVEVLGDGYRLMSRPLTVSYGPSVDFVSTSTAGGIPAAGMGGLGQPEVVKFSWSSAATAIHAGLIALAWQHAMNQGWDRDQLIEVLSSCSSRSGITDFSGEPVEAVVGHGIVDAYCAVGGVRRVEIAGPRQADRDSPAVLTAVTDEGSPSGSAPPSHLSYQWTVDGAQAGDARNLRVDTSSPGDQRVEVLVRDERDGSVVTASSTIRVNSPSDQKLVAIRSLRWTSYVADWATFFNGGRHDRWVNSGHALPTGCEVVGVKGLLVDSHGDAELGEEPALSRDAGNRGFTVSRADVSPSSLEVLVHQWHDGLSAVRTTVVYEVREPQGVDCSVPGVLRDF